MRLTFFGKRGLGFPTAVQVLVLWLNCVILTLPASGVEVCPVSRAFKAQSEHIKNVRQYRQIQSRLCALSEAATSTSGVDMQASILKLGIRLEEAKTKYPRNLACSKSLSACWRLQVHLLGVICWGTLRIFVPTLNPTLALLEWLSCLRGLGCGEQVLGSGKGMQSFQVSDMKFPTA